MKPQHTPAPWKAAKSDVSRMLLIWDTQMEKDSPKLLATVSTKDVGMEQAEANAHLIAAAPDLLKALELIQYHTAAHKMIDDPIYSKINALATKAIAKAKGGQQ